MAEPDNSLFSRADEERIQAVTVTTVGHLQDIAQKEGLSAMLSEGIGLMWGVTHAFKKMGLKGIHKGMRKKLADYMSQP